MRKLCFAIGVVVLLACQGCSSAESSMPKDASSAVSQAAKTAENLKKLKFDYPKDPKCGQALSAGVEDSTEYKGKIYGFCSKECKDEFLKSPESFLSRIISL